MSMFCSCLIEDMEGFPINQGAGLHCPKKKQLKLKFITDHHSTHNETQWGKTHCTSTNLQASALRHQRQERQLVNIGVNY